MREEHKIIKDLNLNNNIKNNGEMRFKFAKDYY